MTIKLLTIDQINKAVDANTNPSAIEGFRRKDYCGKGEADLQVMDGAREFVSKITTDTRDRDNEIINPKGIDFTHFMKNPVILWSHNYNEPAIGRCQWVKRWTETKDNEKRCRGYLAKGVVATGISKAEEIFSLMQQRILSTVSIGFIPTKGHEPTDDEISKNPDWAGVDWIHDKCSMLEYSICNVQSNPDAVIDSVSKGELEVSIPMQQELGIWKPLQIEKKALPYKRTAQDGIEAGWNLSEELRAADSEKLHDMAAWSDDGEFKFIHHRSTGGVPVVFAGVVQAMTKLQTFASKIPEADRQGVWNHLSKHFEEFGREAPPLVKEIGIVRMDTIKTIAIETTSIDAVDPIEVNRPINIVGVNVFKPIDNIKPTPKTPEQIAQDVIEHREVHTLGRV